MKKKMFVSIGIIALTGFILYATLVTKVYQKEISTKSSLLRIQNQLSVVENVCGWYFPFADKDTAALKFTNKFTVADSSLQLTVSSQYGISNVYSIKEKGKEKKVVFNIITDTAGNSAIRLFYENTLWHDIFGTNKIAVNAEKSLLNLKDYLEDNQKIYGYKIEMIEVVDSSFLFTSRIIANDKKRETIKNLFTNLINYAKQKNAGYSGTRIFYSIADGKDSTHLFLSVGITNSKEIAYTGDITLKNMPFKKNLLTAFYQGRFADISKALNVLERFKTENGLSSMAIPFVKLITDGVDFDDNQIIQAQVCYPVY